MSAIKLSTPSSGSISLSPENTASNLTITVPAVTGTMAIQGPAFSAYASTTQTINQNTTVKLIFDLKKFDTNNNFASSRFTPTVAGYFNITGLFQWMGSVNTSAVISLKIFKNGSQYSEIYVGGSSYLYEVKGGSDIVPMNGTTDYLELYLYHNVANSPVIGSQFSGSLVRSA